MMRVDMDLYWYGYRALWHLVAEDIANSARELTSKYSEGSPQFLAGQDFLLLR